MINHDHAQFSITLSPLKDPNHKNVKIIFQPTTVTTPPPLAHSRKFKRLLTAVGRVPPNRPRKIRGKWGGIVLIWAWSKSRIQIKGPDKKNIFNSNSREQTKLIKIRAVRLNAHLISPWFIPIVKRKILPQNQNKQYNYSTGISISLLKREPLAKR